MWQSLCLNNMPWNLFGKWRGGELIPPLDDWPVLCHFSCSHSMMWQSVTVTSSLQQRFSKSELPDTRSRGPRHYFCPAVVLKAWVCGRSPAEIVGWNLTGAWMLVCCECCVLSGRGLCDGLITRSEESYRLWCVVVCDQETSWMRRPWPANVTNITKKTNFRDRKNTYEHNLLNEGQTERSLPGKICTKWMNTSQ